MPVIYTSLQENQKTIVRSCFFSVIEDVARAVGISSDAILTMHRGIEVSRTDNRTNVSGKGTPNLPSTQSQRRITATVTDNYDDESITSSTVSRNDTAPVFLDNDIGVKVYPVYVKTMMKVELVYTCGSKTEAGRVRDDIRVRLSQARNILHHEVNYNILLPETVQDFIADVHELKNRLVPETLQSYFLSHSTKRVHQVTDLANAGNTKIAIREKQVRIVGVFDFHDTPPEVEQNAETNTYKVSLGYSFTADIPTGMCMQYPTMVCNQPMPAKYLTFVEDKKISLLKASQNLSYTSRSMSDLAHFESQRQIGHKVQESLPLNVPLFDEFYERVGHKGYVIVASFLSQVEEVGCKGLFNLRDLEDFYLDDKLLAFLAAGERAWVVNPYMSPFYFGLHQEGRHYDNNILTIDADLNISSKVKLALLRPTRVTLSVCLDTTALNPVVMERFKQNPEMYLLYLNELVKGITNYKSEYAQMGVTDNTFYRNFVIMLSLAVDREDHDFLKAFVRTMAQDTRMLQALVGTLKGNYPLLYARLCAVVNLERYKYNDSYKEGDIGVERYAMRSVMNTSTSVQQKL